MARVLLIVNPAAARTNPDVVRTVSVVLEREGWDVDVVGTTRTGHAAELAREGVREGADVVAVYGGDGTTMQAVEGVMGSEVPVALIPGGTGNLLAGNLRLPRDPERAALVVATGVPRAVDLGRVDRADGPRFFAVACGAGYDARVMAGTGSELKRRWGMAAYVATTLRLITGIRSANHVITIDGVEYDAHAAMVLVANCGEVIPPFIKLRTGIRPDDGLLDVVVMRADSFGQSVRAVWDLLRDAPTAEGLETYVGYARGREVRVESDPVQPVQLDGEPGGETPFTVNVVPGAIRILVP
jgi:YegS/Rv2252/BmrU family lipid kinase